MASRRWHQDAALALGGYSSAAGSSGRSPRDFCSGGYRLALWRWGLLRTPEEVRPPAVLARAASLFAAHPTVDPVPAIERLLDDPVLMQAHRDMLPPPRRPGIDPLDVPLLVARAKLQEAASVEAAWTAMSRDERRACLLDAAALDLATELGRKR